MFNEISKKELSESDRLLSEYQSALAFTNKIELDRINDELLELVEAQKKFLIKEDFANASSAKGKADALRGRRANLAISLGLKRELAQNALRKHNAPGIDLLIERLTRLYAGIGSQKTLEILSEEYGSMYRKIYKIRSNAIQILRAQLPVSEAHASIKTKIMTLSEASEIVNGLSAKYQSTFEADQFSLIEPEFLAFRELVSSRALDLKKETPIILSGEIIKSIINQLESLQVKDRVFYKAA